MQIFLKIYFFYFVPFSMTFPRLETHTRFPHSRFSSRIRRPWSWSFVWIPKGSGVDWQTDRPMGRKCWEGCGRSQSKSERVIGRPRSSGGWPWCAAAWRRTRCKRPSQRRRPGGSLKRTGQEQTQDQHSLNHTFFSFVYVTLVNRRAPLAL